MWKCISRGVKESFERGINIGRSDTRVKNEARGRRSCCWRFSTAAVKRCNENFKGKCSEKDKNEETEEKTRKTIPPNACDAWIGAFSYSSALVLGWVLTQPYHHWRKWWEVRDFKYLSQTRPGNLVHLLTRIAVSQPVLNLHPQSAVKLCNDESTPPITYGPITAEQAVEEAAQELVSVHNSVLGEVENRRGVDLITRKKNREAVAHFRSASSRGHAPAAYNLAHCYEMGLGIRQDFSQAAKWYQVAADKGHAEAMYNLGVFYAHGWGGLEPSNRKARQLFAEAAKKGQPDAMAALGIPEPGTKDTPSIPSIDKNDWGFSESYNPGDNTRALNEDPNTLYDLAVSFENSVQDDSDPYLIMQLYDLASSKGHALAKTKLHVLKAYDAIGLLSEFFLSKKKLNGMEPEGLFLTSHSTP